MSFELKSSLEGAIKSKIEVKRTQSPNKNK